MDEIDRILVPRRSLGDQIDIQCFQGGAFKEPPQQAGVSGKRMRADQYSVIEQAQIQKIFENGSRWGIQDGKPRSFQKRASLPLAGPHFTNLLLKLQTL